MQEPRAVRPEIESRNVAAVTESLPNLKTGITPKTVEALEARKHAPFKAIEHQNPCVVMKRTGLVEVLNHCPRRSV
jgi:hypothetical protein